MDTVERETILIVFSTEDIHEVEKVIIFKDRETAINALFGEHQGRSILMMAEVNREVTAVNMPLPGLEA